MPLKPRTIIYRDGDAAPAVFINGNGVVVAVKELPGGGRQVDS